METNDSYVYLHKRKDNGVVFYVGHGRLERCNQSSAGKTKDWKIVCNEAGGFVVEKIEEGLSKRQAIEREEYWISNPKPEWELVNKRKPTQVYDMNFNELNNLFYYDETSPSCLRYKIDRYKNKGAISKRVGDVAGNIKTRAGKKMNWKVSVGSETGSNKRAYLVHRIVWVLLNGSINDSMVIDHIDGNPLNNKISNLRQTTYKVNAMNRIHKCSDIDKIVGVNRKSNKGRYYWEGSYFDTCYERHTKSFSVSKYGEEQAKLLAIKFRIEGVELHCTDMTERHANLEKLKQDLSTLSSL